MNPRPNTAKFVLNTCAACLARQNPVSTIANPACMKITSTAPMTTHSRFRLTPTSLTPGISDPSNTGSGTSPANAGTAVSPSTRTTKVATSALLVHNFRFTLSSCLRARATLRPEHTLRRAPLPSPSRGTSPTSRGKRTVRGARYSVCAVA